MSHADLAVSDNAPEAQATLSDADMRMAMLRRLASIGMRLAEEVVERAINSPYHPEPVHEPCRAFATVSRAVRLTIVLQARAEAGLLAVRSGRRLAADADLGSGAARSVATARPASDDADADDDRDNNHNGDAPERLDRSRESLSEYEGERFDESLARPFEACVAAIHADLGLEPEDDPAARSPDLLPARVAPAPMETSTRRRAFGSAASAALLVGALDPPSSA